MQIAFKNVEIYIANIDNYLPNTMLALKFSIKNQSFFVSARNYLKIIIEINFCRISYKDSFY